jgi:hypothetical protein
MEWPKGKKRSPEERDRISAGLKGSPARVAYHKRRKGDGDRLRTSPRAIAQRAHINAPERKAGPNNPAWKGDDAGYLAMHERVYRARGSASVYPCEHCGDAERKHHWASVSGNYADVNDFIPLCVPCHSTFDCANRRQRAT